MADRRPDNIDNFSRIKNERLLFMLHLVRMVCPVLVAVVTNRWAVSAIAWVVWKTVNHF